MNRKTFFQMLGMTAASFFLPWTVKGQGNQDALYAEIKKELERRALLVLQHVYFDTTSISGLKSGAGKVNYVLSEYMNELRQQGRIFDYKVTQDDYLKTTIIKQRNLGLKSEIYVSYRLHPSDGYRSIKVEVVHSGMIGAEVLRVMENEKVSI